MSYRLDQRDEADVRYWLGDDLRGDVWGEVRLQLAGRSAPSTSPSRTSSPSGTPRRTTTGDWVFHGTEGRGPPVRPHRGEDEECPPTSTHIASQTLIRVSEHDQLLEGIWERLHQKCNDPTGPGRHGSATARRSTSATRVTGAARVRHLRGHRAAALRHPRRHLSASRGRAATRKRRLTRLEALMQFGTRLERHGEDTSESDKDPPGGDGGRRRPTLVEGLPGVHRTSPTWRTRPGWSRRRPLPEEIPTTELAWLEEQHRAPQAAYRRRKWAALSGLSREQVVRWFEKKKILKRGDGTHHLVTVDDVRQEWPSFWRSIQRRISHLVGTALEGLDDRASRAEACEPCAGVLRRQCCP